MRGYFGIGIYGCKTAENVGTLWRSAHNFGARFIFTVGHRYQRHPSDTTKAYLHVPLFQYPDMKTLLAGLPAACLLVGVEQTERARNLTSYSHAERAIYLLGAEDRGLPLEVLAACISVVSIDTPRCLNVAVAGSIIMYDRLTKQEIGASK